jgi:hypothetical protein
MFGGSHQRTPWRLSARPKLVAVGLGGGNVDHPCSQEWPEAPIAGDVDEFKIVGRTDEHALARVILTGLAGGRAIAIGQG